MRLNLADYPDEEEDREWDAHVQRYRLHHGPELRAWIAKVAAGFHDRWIETADGWVPRSRIHSQRGGR